MKRVRSLGLTLLALTFCSFPLWAEEAGDPLTTKVLLSDILMPEPTFTSSCSASRYCWDGSIIQCSCPTGSCTSSSSGFGSVHCDCTWNPDYYYTCPDPNPCQSGLRCTNSDQCGTDGVCFSARCVC